MNSSTALILLAVIGSAFLLTSTIHAHDVDITKEESDPFVIGGYLPEYRSYINLNATSVHLTDLMLFSLTPESVVHYSSKSPPSPSCCLSSEHYDLIQKAKSYKNEINHGGPQTNKGSRILRLFVTIGGGGRSQGFVDVISGNADMKKSFLKGLEKLCEDEQLDGIDLDFEGIQSMEQWNAYLHLLMQASSFLHSKNLMLTVALHPGQYLPQEVCQSVDRVHLMTYDMFPPPNAQHGTKDAATNERKGHHASMHSMQDAVSSFVKRGCPPGKIIVGVPAYARHEINLGMVKTYSEVMDEYLSGNDDSNIDSMNNWKGYQFDSPSDVREKVDYVTQNGLGGIFFWELGQDKQLPGVGEGGILLEAAAISKTQDQSYDHGDEL